MDTMLILIQHVQVQKSPDVVEDPGFHFCLQLHSIHSFPHHFPHKNSYVEGVEGTLW